MSRGKAGAGASCSRPTLISLLVTREVPWPTPQDASSALTPWSFPEGSLPEGLFREGSRWRSPVSGWRGFWNAEAGRCLSCEPTEGADDPLGRIAALGPMASMPVAPASTSPFASAASVEPGQPLPQRLEAAWLQGQLSRFAELRLAHKQDPLRPVDVVAVEPDRLTDSKAGCGGGLCTSGTFTYTPGSSTKYLVGLGSFSTGTLRLAVPADKAPIARSTPIAGACPSRNPPPRV